jgi:hypothetical protein
MLPKKWITDSWFLLDDNAPAHRSVLVKEFLPKNDVTTLEYLPYPDLAPADFTCTSSEISTKGTALL